MMAVLYYIHDPMCSWCWAFRPVWSAVQAQLPESLQVKYLLGGLAPDSALPMEAATQAVLLSEIRRSQGMGVAGFPALVVKCNDRYQHIRIDYNDASVIVQQLANCQCL